MNKILVIGADGQLGKALLSVYEKSDDQILFTNRKELDICDPKSIQSTLSNFQPDYIINCAAYTAVDKAEEEQSKAFQINKDGVINLINESEELQSEIIHISTDYVFNGDSTIPYKETDPIDPQSVYGESKAEGEIALRELAPNRSIIIRTSWLYSEFGHNFLKTMLRLGKERDSLNVVDDQIGVPTYSKDLAIVIFELIRSNIQLDSENNILHFTNSGLSNWCAFAKEIMKIAKLPCEINPIPTSSFPTPAKRPTYSVLDTDKIKSLLGINIRPWEEAMKECINTIKKN